MILVRPFPLEAIVIRHSELVSESASSKQTLKQVQGDVLYWMPLLGGKGGSALFLFKK